MIVRVAQPREDGNKGGHVCTTYKNIQRIRVDPCGALFLLRSNGRDCVCIAPGFWSGYETEGADVD